MQEEIPLVQASQGILQREMDNLVQAAEQASARQQAMLEEQEALMDHFLTQQKAVRLLLDVPCSAQGPQ